MTRKPQPAKVLLSELSGVSPDDFALVVRTHAENLRAWHKVDHTPYPAPWAPSVVERCIVGPDFTIAYELIDDVSPTLRQIKDVALARIAEVEGDLLASILPPGKVRLARDRQNAEDKKALTRLDRLRLRTAEIMAEIEDWTAPPPEGWDANLRMRLTK